MVQRCGLQAPQHCTQASLQVQRGEKRRRADRTENGVGRRADEGEGQHRGRRRDGERLMDSGEALRP